MKTFLDIETINELPEDEAKARIAETIKHPAAMKKQETIDDWQNGAGKYAGAKDAAIEVEYRKGSLDGAKGQICSVAFAIEDGDIESDSDGDQCEYDLLDSFFDTLDYQLKGRPPFFIGHQIGNFDLKFIFHRAVILGIRPPFELPFYGRHGQHFYDTNQAWCGFRDRISQDNLCKSLGIEGKPSDIDGSKVWTVYKSGGIDRIEAYNRDDVEKNRMIYNRLNFL